MQRDLVVKASVGDHAAFSELVAVAISGLYRVAYLILRHPETASDAVQNAVFAAWQDIRTLRDPDRFDAWLHRLTVRACYRLAHSERRRAAAEGHLRTFDYPPAVDDDLRLLAIRDQLERAFVYLTAEERAVLVLRYQLDLPLSEDADILGIPLGTMKSRLNRAVGALRAAIEAQERASLATGATP